jgi:hypothetical protein
MKQIQIVRHLLIQISCNTSITSLASFQFCSYLQVEFVREHILTFYRPPRFSTWMRSDRNVYRIPVIRLAIMFPHELWIQRDIAASSTQQGVKEAKEILDKE